MPEPDTELPQIAVSPPIRRNFFRFSILGVLLFTAVLAGMFAVARLPKDRDEQRYPVIVVTKRGLYDRRATYEVRFGRRIRERYESEWEGGVEKLSSIRIYDYGGGRFYLTDPIHPRELLTAAHRQAFDAIRTLVRSKVDFDGMSWADERPPAGTPATPRAPFTATIYPDIAPPRAESFDPQPSATPASSTP
jgi:hypothetical protein